MQGGHLAQGDLHHQGRDGEQGGSHCEQEAEQYPVSQDVLPSSHLTHVLAHVCHGHPHGAHGGPGGWDEAVEEEKKKPERK